MLRILSLLLVVIFTASKSPQEYIVVEKRSFSVDVSTSFGDFNCEYQLQTKDTLFFQSSGKLSRAEYAIPIKAFKCGNFILNTDFQKTLKADTYPITSIILSDWVPHPNGYRCKVHLNIVGKELFFSNFIVKKNNKTLSGEVVISFTDLELPTPRKMGGLLKVKDEITLHITLETQ
ncbi:MAG: hypothetical protein Q4G08_06150 [Capnocytophaga sp.]|nr:hypothetical protein [Capnocytophaga sp.]